MVVQRNASPAPQQKHANKEPIVVQDLHVLNRVRLHDMSSQCMHLRGASHHPSGRVLVLQWAELHVVGMQGVAQGLDGSHGRLGGVCSSGCDFQGGGARLRHVLTQRHEP